MAKEEKVLPDANPYIAQYISELEKELAKLSAERAEADKLTTSKELTQEQLQLIRDRLKDFATRIKFEPPEVQHLIIKQYLDIIVFDKAASHLKFSSILITQVDQMMPQSRSWKKPYSFH